jgi:hypothetical protein
MKSHLTGERAPLLFVNQESVRFYRKRQRDRLGFSLVKLHAQQD